MRSKYRYIQLLLLHLDRGSIEHLTPIYLYSTHNDILAILEATAKSSLQARCTNSSGLQELIHSQLTEKSIISYLTKMFIGVFTSGRL
jgi:hypothetical protein